MNTRMPALSTQRGISRLAWLLFALGAGALAYWLVPHGKPAAPFELSPRDVWLIGDIPSFAVEVHWRQPGYMRPLSGPAAGRPYRFVICFYDQAAVQHDCAARSDVIHVEEREAQTITRTTLQRRGWQDWWPGYQYRLSVTLPEAALDKALGWTVGACSEAANSSCSFAEPRTLSFTARDLAAGRIDDDVVASGVMVTTVDVRNDGRTDGERYELGTVLWEILLQPRSTVALTDVNDPLVMAGDVVITEEGQEHPVADYRNGTRPVSEVRGIHRPGSARGSFTRVIDPVPAPLPVGQTLAPGTNNTIIESVPTCPEGESCIVGPSQRPSLFAVFAKVDPQLLLWEFEEEDNDAFKNGVYVP